MAFGGLQKTPMPILLRGLDQKNPKQAAITGELDVLQNMIAVKGTGNQTYEFLPRPGVDALTPSTVDFGSITAGWRLATLGSQLVLFTGQSCYRRASNGWHRVTATAPMIGVQTTPIASNSLNTGSTDAVYANGYRVSAATVATGNGTDANLVVTVVDSAGNQVAQAILALVSLNGFPRVIASGTAVLIFWQSVPNLMAVKFDTTTLTFGSPVTVASSLVATPGVQLYDVQAVSTSGTVAMIYDNSGTSTYHQRLISVSSMALGSDTDSGIGLMGAIAYCVNDWSTNTLYVAYGGAGNGISVKTFDATTLAAGSTTSFDPAITQVYSITGVRAGSTVTVIATTSPDGTSHAPFPYDRRIVKSTGSAVVDVFRSLSLTSHAMVANGTIYVVARYMGTGQGCLFLVDVGAKALAGRALPDVGATEDVGAAGALANLAAAETANVWLSAALKNFATTTEAGALAAYVGPVQVAFTLLDASLGRAVELNGGLHVPGALPMLYDGAQLVEDGFPIAPEQSDTIVTAGGGSLVSAATYAVRCCYSWIDAAGNLHRSAPTIVAQEFVTGATDTQATLSIPTLRATAKSGVSVEVYVTPSNGDGSSYFMVTDPLQPLVNDPTVDRVAFVINQDDTTIEAGTPLYTDGGILDNLAPPPCRVMAVHRGRILVGGVDGDPQAVEFSKSVQPGFGVAFNDGLVSRLNSTSEAVVSLGTMDAYAVACTASTTWASGDQYPDDVGVGGVLDFQEYSGTTGAALAGVLARTDQGTITWAGASKGAWRLSRGLSWDYVGSAIEDDAATFTPVAVFAVPGQNQIRVIGQRGGVSTAFVFETIFGTWGRWTYPTAPAAIVDAVIWNGAVAYLCANGAVVTEDTTTFDDLATPDSVPHQIEISALNLAGVSGYQRVYITQIIGRVLGTGGFTLRAVQTIDSLVKAAKSKTIGPSDVDLDAEIDPGPDGKCTDYSLLVSDTGNGPNTAFSIAAFTLLVGIKAGLDKLPPANRMT